MSLKLSPPRASNTNRAYRGATGLCDEKGDRAQTRTWSTSSSCWSLEQQNESFFYTSEAKLLALKPLWTWLYHLLNYINFSSAMLFILTKQLSSTKP